MKRGFATPSGNTARTPTPAASRPTPDTPTAFSFEEAADLLAQRDIFVTPIPADQQAGLLDRDAFDACRGFGAQQVVAKSSTKPRTDLLVIRSSDR